jgi:hypothetical protein
MKTISKILIALLVAISINAQADNGNEVKGDANSIAPALTVNVTGQVVDMVTGEALVGVALKVNNETIYTDFDGNFQTTISNQKTLLLVANLISYNTQELVIEPNSSKSIKVELNPLKK